MRFRALGVLVLLALLVGQVVSANIPMPGLAPKMYANPGAAYHVAVDSQGNIIEGRWDNAVSQTGIVIKFDRNGGQLWQYTFDQGSGWASVAVSADGTILAAPVSGGLVAKLSTDGRLIQQMSIPGNAPSVSDLWVGRDGAIWIAGAVGHTTAGFLSRIDSTGQTSWSRVVPMSIPDRYIGTTSTSDGGAVVTTGRGTAKYDASGNQQWLSSLGGSGIASDDSGNVFLAYGYIAKLDASGRLVWQVNEPATKVRMLDGVPVFMRAYPVGIGPFPQLYVNTFDVSARDSASGAWVWGFKHASGTGFSLGALSDLYVRPGYIAFSNPETDSALYAGSWLAAVCDGVANPPALARACVFTPV